MSPLEAGLWRLWPAPSSEHLLEGLTPSERGLIVTNVDDLDQAQYTARYAYEAEHGGWPAGDVRVGDDCPRPKIMFPPVSYAPDFVTTNAGEIVSARLRYAMALPDVCVQYRSVELTDGSDLAYEQDYRWMPYLACEVILDVERSRLNFDVPIGPEGLEHPHFDDVVHFVVRDDVEPRAGLFRMYGRPSTIIATDALIRRVERAGCTGLQFIDLALASKRPMQFILRPHSD